MGSKTGNHLACEQCGTALKPDDAHCLHCMLLGGLDEAAPAAAAKTATAAEPETLSGTRFYLPDEQEAELRERHEEIRAKRGFADGT